MYVLISRFASGISLASSFSQSLLWALRQALPLVFHMAMICNSQECLESGICMLFHKGNFAYWSWFDGMHGAQEFTYAMGICGRVMHRNLWSYFYSRKGGAWMWLFPLCWQQQKMKVKVYAGSHQRALRKGSQLVLTLARAPPETRKKEKQQRLMRFRRVVSHAFRPAPSPPEASRSTRNPPIRSPIIITVVVKVYFVLFL